MADDSWSDLEIDEETCILLDQHQSTSSHETPQGEEPLATAIAESAREETLHEMAVRIHNQRLDNVLLANGMERRPVPPDGNCFFAAAAVHLDNHTALTLRASLCQHVEENLDHYVGFFHLDEDEGGDNVKDLARYLLSQLRNPGVWDNAANDIMPLALANYSQRRVKIFASKTTKQFINITPSLSTAASVFSPIYIAYLAVKNREHYDSCVKMRRHLYKMFGMAESEAKSASPPPSGPLSASSLPLSTLPSPPFSTQPTVPESDQQEPPSTPPPPPSPPSSAQPPVPESDQLEPPSTPPSHAAIQSSPSSDLSRQLQVYNTPQKKTPPKKRKAQPETWKKNSRKMLKLQGQEYVTSRGKTARRRQVQDTNCNCKYQCKEKISFDKRRAIFNTYYSLDSYERQKDFICRHVNQKNTRTYLDDNKEPITNKRQVSRSYYLTSEGEKVQVCKTFFLATLDVGHGYVSHALQNSEDGTFVGQDRRGKHTPANKISLHDKTQVKRHIESFPAVESHYCRRGSRRKFLDSRLNISRMYSLYCDTCKEKGEAPVSSSFYREVFNTEYNLAFHKPKKDQCLICTRYLEEKRAKELTDERQKEYDEHQARKKESREEKMKDKKLSQTQEDTHTVTFDMEAVLTTPCSLVSQVHYKRKLAVYNLTVFSLTDKEASCFVWNECDGNKGSCEVATCLLRYIQSLPEKITRVILYSDTCGGQNRNQFVAAALHFAVKSINHIQVIDQKFLESGHTHMECDAIHATIEKAKRNASIFIPDQWHTVIEMARSNFPYTVIPLEYSDILDFKYLAAQTMRNTKTDITGTRISWLKIKWLRYTKEEDTVYFKYRMSENFRSLRIKGSSRRGRQQQAPISVQDIPQRYTSRLPLSEAKRNDLLDLCRLGVVPQRHHKFYQQLPSASTAPDRLAEPDVTEQDTDSGEDL